MRAIALVVMFGCWSESARPVPLANTSSAPPVVDRKTARDDTSRARQAFESGEQHYNAGEFAAAAADFEAAYRDSPNYVLLYNVAQAYRQAGDRTHAVEYYQRFLDEGGAQIKQPVRDLVTDQIRQLSAP